MVAEQQTPSPERCAVLLSHPWGTTGSCDCRWGPGERHGDQTLNASRLQQSASLPWAGSLGLAVRVGLPVWKVALQSCASSLDIDLGLWPSPKGSVEDQGCSRRPRAFHTQPTYPLGSQEPQRRPS